MSLKESLKDGALVIRIEDEEMFIHSDEGVFVYIVRASEEVRGLPICCSNCKSTSWQLESIGKRGYLVVCCACGEKWMLVAAKENR